MIGPLQKFRNVEAKKVAKAIISKMDSVEEGIHYIDYKYFKKFLILLFLVLIIFFMPLHALRSQNAFANTK